MKPKVSTITKDFTVKLFGGTSATIPNVKFTVFTWPDGTTEEYIAPSESDRIEQEVEKLHPGYYKEHPRDKFKK